MRKSTAENQPHAQRLQEAFTDDHQTLTRGLVKLVQAVESNDIVQAQKIARELDVQCGGHIQFEEEHLYPEIAARRDANFIERLYREHDLGQEALTAIMHRPADRPLSDRDRDAVLVKLHKTLEHAYACGSLLSYASVFEPPLQARLLEALIRCRAEAQRWTRLPRHHSDDETAS